MPAATGPSKPQQSRTDSTQARLMQRSLTYEYAGNLHAHTVYSDGHGTHEDIASAAMRAGLDFIVVTDHNVWVQGLDGYRYHGDRRVLLLTGEEIHDQVREPQKNHILVFEAHRELAGLAKEPQRLVDGVKQAGGLAFIAHPFELAAPAIHEPALDWVDWQVEGLTGIEIWNTMSEFKGHLTSGMAALFYAYFPDFSTYRPFPKSLAIWDRMLASGVRVVGLGGADAHATPVRAGIFRRVVFPYEYLFRAVNTHILTDEPLTGDAEGDRRRLFHHIRQGHCFVGNDLAAPSRGFSFTGNGEHGMVVQGDTIKARLGITLQISLPARADVRLLRNGQLLKRWSGVDSAVKTVVDPGTYRVEAYRPFKGRLRGWIYSNPIYVTA
jgi:hypothetical protein